MTIEDIHGQLMELLRSKLEPFKIPNDIVRGLRDDILLLMRPKDVRRNGAAVMTQEASIAGDLAKRGEIPPELAKPKIV